jgi:hypothetical protein
MVSEVIYHRLLQTQQVLNLLNLESYNVNEVWNMSFDVTGDTAVQPLGCGWTPQGITLIYDYPT